MTLPVLDDLCVRGLLHCLRAGERAAVTIGGTGFRPEDIEALRFWWALSSSVGHLAERARAHPREISGSIGAEERVAVGEIPGILDAGETVRIQARTGDTTLFAVIEPSPTWVSGPNRLLATTLLEAERVLLAANKSHSGGVFADIAAVRARILEDALRVSAIREVLATPAGRARITPYERRQAGKARAPLYRLAVEAADLLRGVEALDPVVLAALFAENLLPALEEWRKFELATLLACAAALGTACGEVPRLDFAFSARRPAARIGRFSLWWQRVLPQRPTAALDVGEAMARNLAAGLLVSEGAGRADITVEVEDRIVGLVECKWFGAPEAAPSAILDACSQIVGYARDEVHQRGGDVSDLLAHSLIALAARGGAPFADGAGGIACADLADMAAGRLAAWAGRVAA